MKILFELEVGMETAVVASALEAQAQLFNATLPPDNPHRGSIKMFRDVTQRLHDQLEKQLEAGDVSWENAGCDHCGINDRVNGSNLCKDCKNGDLV